MSCPQSIFNAHRTDDALNTYTALLHEADSYISFFKKRCEIEDECQAQLAKLALRQSESDRKFASDHHELAPTCSARLAWQEITSNVQQDAQLRKNWIKKIRENVIEPLEKFKSIKERTLNRIRDDIRNSANDHKEYLATVQRLKKQYDRKCEEVNQHHSMVEAIEFRDKLIEEKQAEWEHVSTALLASAPQTHDIPSPPSYPHSTPRRSGDFLSNSTNSNSTPSTSAVARSPFIISGATSTALRDTAIPVPANPLQAKGNDVLHALRNNTNNLIQRLNSRKDYKAGAPSNNMSGTDDGTIRPSALRGVKLKREAEDADRDYRKGVFHLETLRLRKEQVIRGARRATEDMVFEASGEAKDTFAYYIDETRMAAVSRISICDHAQYLVDKISPEEDAHNFSINQPEEFNEPKVLYENAFTGPCRSLLFGVAINDYYASHPGKGWVPLLVRMCIEEIEKRGIKLEGIYRISGKMQNVTQLVNEIEKDEEAFRFDPERHDPYTIAGVLKLYLRQLPTPLFHFPLVERVAFSNNLDEHFQNGFSILIKKIRKLLPAHQATLRLVCEHLHRVSLHSDENKMTSSNLGLVFAPAVFSEEAGVQLPPQAWKDSVMEVLIDHHEDIFDDFPIAEPSGGNGGGGTRSQRTSFVNRPPSPSARKSLEAERYESYSRSVSPIRPIVSQSASQLPPPSALSHPVDLNISQPQSMKTTTGQNPVDDFFEQRSTKRSSMGSMPGFQSSLIRQASSTSKTAKRSFSLRKKSSPPNYRTVQNLGMPGPASARHSFDSHSSTGAVETTFPDNQSHHGLAVSSALTQPEFTVLSRSERPALNLYDPQQNFQSSPQLQRQPPPPTLITSHSQTISPSASVTSNGTGADELSKPSNHSLAEAPHSTAHKGLLDHTDVQKPANELGGFGNLKPSLSVDHQEAREKRMNDSAVEELAVEELAVEELVNVAVATASPVKKSSDDLNDCASRQGQHLQQEQQHEQQQQRRQEPQKQHQQHQQERPLHQQ